MITDLEEAPKGNPAVQSKYSRGVDLIARVFRYLSQEGLINFGVYRRIPRPPIGHLVQSMHNH